MRAIRRPGVTHASRLASSWISRTRRTRTRSTTFSGAPSRERRCRTRARAACRPSSGSEGGDLTPRRWFLTALSFLFAIGASVYIIRSSWSAEGARVGLPLWGHLACLAAASLEVLTRSIKIRLSAAAVRIPLTLRTAVRVSLGGDFGGSITPSRSGGEPARFLILREAALPVADALVILFLELALEVLSLASLAVIIYAVLGGSSNAVRGLVGMVGVYA